MDPGLQTAGMTAGIFKFIWDSHKKAQKTHNIRTYILCATMCLIVANCLICVNLRNLRIYLCCD